MATSALEREIDRLYQLPLGDFTAARNALAKTGGPRVRALVKPALPAWAVNQLYWRNRAAWDALVAAAEAQRRAHHAVLAGRKADLRAAGRSHDEAVDAALKAALAILADEGHPVTEATRQAVSTTLRAVPGDEPAGRLTRTIQPGGFEMLAGLTIAGAGRKPPRSSPSPARTRETVRPTAPKRDVDRKAVARARAQVEGAARAVRQAEHAARREEFEAARAAREAGKTERAAADAREAYDAAREALEEAEAAVPRAVRAREATARRAQQSATALETARARLEQAEARLAALDR
jgi:hypothetical protein